MVPREKHRYAAVTLALMLLLGTGLSSPTTTPDLLTSSPTLPSVSPPKSTSSSSSSSMVSSFSKSSTSMTSSLSQDNSTLNLTMPPLPVSKENIPTTLPVAPQTPLLSELHLTTFEPSAPTHHLPLPTIELSQDKVPTTDPQEILSATKFNTAEPSSTLEQMPPLGSKVTETKPLEAIPQTLSSTLESVTIDTNPLLPSTSVLLTIDPSSSTSQSLTSNVTIVNPPSSLLTPINQTTLTPISNPSSFEHSTPPTQFPASITSPPQLKTTFEDLSSSITLPPATFFEPQEGSPTPSGSVLKSLPTTTSTSAPLIVSPLSPSSLPSATEIQQHTSTSPVLPSLSPISPVASQSSTKADVASQAQLPRTIAATSPLDNSSVEEFQNLTKEYFQWKLQEFPEFASQIGGNDKSAMHLDKMDAETFQKRRASVANFLERAQGINTGQFSERNLVYYKVFIYELSEYLKNFKYLKFFMPINNLGTPPTHLEYLLKKATVLKNYNNYLQLLSRYSEFTRHVDETITLMRKNLANNLMPSNWSLYKVPALLEDYLVPVNESIFYEPFSHISLDITSEEKEVLRRQAVPVVSRILKSIKKLKDVFETEYYPAARPDVGASSLPGGTEYYQACLRFHTSTDMTPQEVHHVGLNEVARIQREVKETGAQLGLPNMTLGEISAILKREPKQLFFSKEDILDTYRSAIYNDIFPLMNQIVNEIPTINVTVEQSIAGQGFASYDDPPKDGSKPGTFFINAKDYENYMKFEVMALSLHETLPGHHMQAVTIIGNDDVPEFLRHVGPYSYKLPPATFALNTAYIEGWGLYSEYLGNELGLYQDPYQRLGRHSFESLRACRLVVDTGMHALGWSRKQAIDYLVENTAFSKAAVEGQIDRYITWPGQATSYKIGEIKIISLRKRAEQALGQLFLLQDFHETVLACIAPLEILEQCVNVYITKTLQRQPQGDSTSSA